MVKFEYTNVKAELRNNDWVVIDWFLDWFVSRGFIEIGLCEDASLTTKNGLQIYVEAGHRSAGVDTEGYLVKGVSAKDQVVGGVELNKGDEFHVDEAGKLNVGSMYRR